MAAAEWYYARNNQQMGPVTWEGLQALAGCGQLKATDLVWRAGMANWAPAAEAKQQPLAPVAPAPVAAADATGGAIGQATPVAALAAQQSWQGPAMGGAPAAGFAGAAAFPGQPLAYGGYATDAPSQKNTAVTAFVCSIVGLFICGLILSIVAIVQANKALEAMRTSGNESGKGLAVAARVIGIVGLLLWGLGMVFRLVAIGLRH